MIALPELLDEFTGSMLEMTWPSIFEKETKQI